MVIYKIENIINKKIYIGQTKTSTTKRFNAHRNQLKANKHFNIHLQRSWNKYGENNFIFSILEFCFQKEELDFLEKYYIKFYNSIDYNYGYNKSLGGTSGEIHTKESIKKISKSKIGKNSGNKNPFYGKTHTIETRKKISAYLKDLYKTKPGPFKGKTFSENVKRKLSENMKLRIQKFGNAFKGRRHKKEFFDKVSGIKNRNYGKFGKESISAKKILAINPEGVEMCFYSGTDAVIYTKCSKSCISGVCTGRYEHTKKWKFKLIGMEF